MIRQHGTVTINPDGLVQIEQFEFDGCENMTQACIEALDWARHCIAVAYDETKLKLREQQ